VKRKWEKDSFYNSAYSAKKGGYASCGANSKSKSSLENSFWGGAYKTIEKSIIAK